MPHSLPYDMLWSTCRAGWAESITHNTGWCTEISSSPALSLNLLVTPTKIFTPSYLVLQYCSTSRIPLLMNRTSRDGDIANSESLYWALSWPTHHHSYWSADSDGIIMVDSPASFWSVKWWTWGESKPPSPPWINLQSSLPYFNPIKILAQPKACLTHWSY